MERIDLQIREQLTMIRQHQQVVNQLRQRKRELTPGSNSRAFFGIDFDDETTGIELVKDSGVKVQDSEAYYDLSGRRVVHPTKGLYIVNGKKVVIK